MIRGILFDLYGTLIDIETDEGGASLYEALSRYAGYHGIVISPEDLRREYWELVEAMVAENRHEFPEFDVTSIFAFIGRKYGLKGCDKQRAVDLAVLFRALSIKRFGLYKGVLDALSSLRKSYALGIVSDAQWAYADPEMEISQLKSFFPVAVLSSRFGMRKPDPRLFRSALEQMGVSAREAVYVGDQPARDLVGAKKAGLRCVLFRNEYIAYDDIRPDACFDDYSRLESIIELLK